MTKPKYKIGDRLKLVNEIEIEIVRPVEGKAAAYIFQLVACPQALSVATEEELIALTA